jgi:nicotinamidase-related amidase
VSQRHGADTVLTGLLDRSALYGVLAEIDALGLDLIEVRHLTADANHQDQVTAAHRDDHYRRAHPNLLREGEAPMTSAPVRDPLADHLITPQNAALLLIDYQPAQLAGVRSMDRALLVKNAVSTVSTIKTFEVPVVHSTINVATGRGQPTLPELADLLTDDKPLDRTTTNSWEDIEFVQAVHATGRRKLIICALWTEICMAFTALDALREGYEVYPVVDAIGGTSPEAHRAGLDRVIQAGGQPISWVSLAVELQRDWARQDTVAAVVEIVLTDRLLKEQ